MKQLALLVFGLTLFLLTACGGSGEQSTTDSNNTPVTTETTDGGTTEPAPATETEDPITDAVVQQACDCQTKAIQDDIFEPSIMMECMGGKTKVQFVEALMGANASEKANSDAINRLTERMNEKCPR